MNEIFDRVVDRRNTNSVKWDKTEELFGEKDLLPLWVADMDFKVAEPILQAVQKQIEHGIFGYPSRPASLYKSIIDWCEKRHQWKIENEWINFTPGVVPALSTIINAFTKPGDKIVIQSPVYHPFFEMVKKNGRTLVNNSLKYDNSRYEMDLDDLEEKLDKDVKLLILCNPHNPVGRVWKREELQRLAEICLKNNILIVSDEIHSDLIYREYKHIPIASLSEEIAKQTITCIAPSKTFNLAGLQTAVTIIQNEKHHDVFKGYTESQGMFFTNSVGLVATEAAYQYGEEWLEHLLDYLTDNVTLLKEFIENRLPEIKVIEPEGTYLIWLDFRTLGLGTKEMEQLTLKEAKVALNEGHIFGKGGAGFKRINIACPRKTLEEALVRIEKAIIGKIKK
jgi:cystathionine beta-lyase